jgi:V/A-type H+/Na+-transporting ATPase subunit E
MQTKLQELTEKIYREGVVKAEAEAGEILDRAREDARQIVESAKREADAIVSGARREAEETHRNSTNELRLATRQMISDLKQQITALVGTKVIAEPVAGAFRRDEFIRDLILSVVKNWNPSGGETVHLGAMVPAEKLEAMQQFLATETGRVLREGVALSGSDRLNSGFMIGPAKGGYRVSFSDEEFTRFITAYLRPRLMQLLFDEEGGSAAE